VNARSVPGTATSAAEKILEEILTLVDVPL
jgi:hypothetical protein